MIRLMNSIERERLNLTPDPLDSYVEGWRARARSDARQNVAWRRRVRGLLPALVSLLTTEFGVTRIVLFGSFARGEAVLGSDVDLLVEGLENERLIEATAVADRLLWTEGIGIDLVPMQMVRESVRERAEREGESLYG